MAVKSKARHDLTLRSIKQEISADARRKVLGAVFMQKIVRNDVKLSERRPDDTGTV